MKIPPNPPPLQPRGNEGFFPMHIAYERFRDTTVSSARHDPQLDAILKRLGINTEWTDRLVKGLVPPPDQTEDRYATCMKIGMLIGIRLMAQEVTFPMGITADDFKAFGGLE